MFDKGLRPRAGKGEARLAMPAGAVSPVFRAKDLHDDDVVRRVQTRASRALVRRVIPLRSLPLLPQVSPTGRVAAQRCASTSGP